MRKYISLRPQAVLFVGVAFLVFGLMLFGPKSVLADSGGIVVNVKQELSSNLSGATVDIQCTGGSMTNLGTSDGSGNVTVLNASVPGGASCGNTDSIDIRIILDGYVTQTTVAAGTYLTGSQNTYNITGVQFSHKSVIKDELGTALTPTSATAGASLVACTVSTSNIYCPVVLADDNTVANGFVVIKDGYVTTTASDVPLASNRTAGTDAQAVTTMTTTNGLDFSHKVAVVNELGTALTATSATAGASLVACTVSTSNIYCPVVLADDNTVANGFVIIKDGYVTTTASDVPLAGNRTVGTGAQQVTTMTTTNGLDFSHKVIVVNELGTALTPTSATAGASLVACTVSTSSVYCPVVIADDNTVANGFVIIKDGYVTTTAADVPLAGNRTVGTGAQQVTTMTTTNGLDFAVKTTITWLDGTSPIESATVTAGDSLAVTCNAGSIGHIYYCIVPLADTAVVVNAVHTGFTSTTGSFTDRTLGTDAQRSVTILMTETASSSGGSGGGGGSSGGATGYANTTTTTTTTSNEPATTSQSQTPNPVQMISEEKSLILDAAQLRTNTGAQLDTAAEAATAAKYTSLWSGLAGYSATEMNGVNNFITYGTGSTKGIGSGERAAALSSYKDSLGKLPKTIADWENVLNIANGRWPFAVSAVSEARAYTNFKTVYGRNANMKNNTDVNSLKMMAYGVRSNKARDLNAERSALVKFKATFGSNPSTARQWNVVRALAYSGVTK